jgi:hypothetical protein
VSADFLIDDTMLAKDFENYMQAFFFETSELAFNILVGLSDVKCLY